MKKSKLPCFSENHELYIAGKGYVKAKNVKAGEYIINETNGKTERVKIIRIIK